MQQQRRRVATALLGKPNLGAQPLKSRQLELIERADRRRREQLSRRFRGSGIQLGLCRGERARRSPSWILSQLSRPLQKRSGRGGATPSEHAASRPLKLIGHRLIRPYRRVRPMPGPPIGVDLWVNRLRKRRVNLLELAQ
jgi:hypothetical protein